MGVMKRRRPVVPKKSHKDALDAVKQGKARVKESFGGLVEIITPGRIVYMSKEFYERETGLYPGNQEEGEKEEKEDHSSDGDSLP